MSRGFTQSWDEVERRFPGSSAAFDRDLGDAWLEGRDGPRFDVYGPVLHVFVGESKEYGHEGPWASAYFNAAEERWIVKRDMRDVPPVRYRVLWRDAQGQDGQRDLVLGESILVGRSTDCAIRTDDAMVSRRHAMIETRADGVYVQDMGSAGGTYRNDRRIADATRMDHADVVRCGSLLMRFIDNSVPAVAPRSMRCPVCGSEVPAGFRFCGTCGTRMDGPN